MNISLTLVDFYLRRYLYVQFIFDCLRWTELFTHFSDFFDQILKIPSSESFEWIIKLTNSWNSQFLTNWNDQVIRCNGWKWFGSFLCNLEPIFVPFLSMKLVHPQFSSLEIADIPITCECYILLSLKLTPGSETIKFNQKHVLWFRFSTVKIFSEKDNSKRLDFSWFNVPNDPHMKPQIWVIEVDLN